MPSIIPGYEYDIFISYRQNDNQDGWVTEFVESLNREIKSTFKEEINIYFDENPHDGLHDHHEVNESLREKLRCLVLIPIVSQTYCDPKAFAWANEFKVFIEQAEEDDYGLKIKLGRGNVASRVLPVRIHEIDDIDRNLFEAEIDGIMRSIDFIYRETGVNRSLRPADERNANLERTDYRNQVNKVANAIKDILNGMIETGSTTQVDKLFEDPQLESKEVKPKQKKTRKTARRAEISGRAKNNILLGLLSITILVAGFIVGRYTFSIPESDLAVIRTTIEMGRKLGWTRRNSIDISKDGSVVVFVMSGLYYNYLNGNDSIRQITGTFNGNISPAISPDAGWVCYEDAIDESIWKIQITGGTPTKICNVGGDVFGLNWIDGYIIFSNETSIFRVSDSGGVPERIYPIQEEEIDTLLWNPQLLPDGETLFFSQHLENNSWSARLWKMNSSEPPKTIIKRATNPQYVAGGFIAYTLDDVLHIQKIDYKKEVLIGQPQLINTKPINSWGYYQQTAQFAISDNGVIVYTENNVSENSHMAWVTRQGEVEIITNSTKRYTNPRVSPSGDQIAVDVEDSEGDNTTVIINANLGTEYLISEDAANPVWHSDGQSIFYKTSSDQIIRYYLDLRKQREVVLDTADFAGRPFRHLGNVSRDGKYMVFSTRYDLWYYDFEADSAIRMDYYNSNQIVGHPVLSSDGKWLAYEVLGRGSMVGEMFVVPFPGPGTRTKVSIDDMHYGVWSPDQTKLYFVKHGSSVKEMWEVDVVTQSVFSSGAPESFYFGRDYNNQGWTFDIHPSGEKFLMVVGEGNISSTEMNLIVNWQEELRDMDGSY